MGDAVPGIRSVIRLSAPAPFNPTRLRGVADFDSS